ncbi:hypothetical protein ACHHYP_00146 [Achlya hypogyna]|uniref:CLASP N-terminal domain-containing protein n=1 Tax=Achlya hypogyna TaxID=1202772 RepID=A0A1V9ZBB7_ACHHY|nr:hypothetical protein ACHHYP_00146 [Achlya hypogyna]
MVAAAEAARMMENLRQKIEACEQILANPEAAWVSRVTSMKRLETAVMALATAEDGVDITPVVGYLLVLANGLLQSLADGRPAVAKQTCSLLSSFAWLCGPSLRPLSEMLLLSVFHLSTKKKQTQVIALAARQCLHSLTKATRYPILLLERAYKQAKDDGDKRMMCVSLLVLVLRFWPPDEVLERSNYISLRRVVLQSVLDDDMAVQAQARLALCLLCEYGQESLHGLHVQLPPEILARIAEEYPESALAQPLPPAPELFEELDPIPELDDEDLESDDSVDRRRRLRAREPTRARDMAYVTLRQGPTASVPGLTFPADSLAVIAEVDEGESSPLPVKASASLLGTAQRSSLAQPGSTTESPTPQGVTPTATPTAVALAAPCITATAAPMAVSEATKMPPPSRSNYVLSSLSQPVVAEAASPVEPSGPATSPGAAPNKELRRPAVKPLLRSQRPTPPPLPLQAPNEPQVAATPVRQAPIDATPAKPVTAAQLAPVGSSKPACSPGRAPDRDLRRPTIKPLLRPQRPAPPPVTESPAPAPKTPKLPPPRLRLDADEAFEETAALYTAGLWSSRKESCDSSEDVDLSFEAAGANLREQLCGPSWSVSTMSPREADWADQLDCSAQSIASNLLDDDDDAVVALLHAEWGTPEPTPPRPAPPSPPPVLLPTPPALFSTPPVLPPTPPVLPPTPSGLPLTPPSLLSAPEPAREAEWDLPPLRLPTVNAAPMAVPVDVPLRHRRRLGSGSALRNDARPPASSRYHPPSPHRPDGGLDRVIASLKDVEKATREAKDLPERRTGLVGPATAAVLAPAPADVPVAAPVAAAKPAAAEPTWRMAAVDAALLLLWWISIVFCMYGLWGALEAYGERKATSLYTAPLQPMLQLQFEVAAASTSAQLDRLLAWVADWRAEMAAREAAMPLLIQASQWTTSALDDLLLRLQASVRAQLV